MIYSKGAAPKGISPENEAPEFKAVSGDRSVADLLEIIIITYNRKKELAQTLDSLLAKLSPVRELRITILDNASTDGTAEICAEYAGKHHNIFHVRHKKNIGGNANVCRAFELANKDYIWVLADDDHYDWSAWPQIAKAIYSGHDAIFTSLVNLCRVIGPGAVLYECTFLPGCIYKTKWFDDSILQGMYGNLHSGLPHITLALSIFENNGTFYIPNEQVVLQSYKFEFIPDLAAQDGKRGITKNHSPFTRNNFWEVGFLNMISHLPKVIADQVFNDLTELYGNKQEYLSFLLLYYKHHDYSTRNLFNIYLGLPKHLKGVFISRLFDALLDKPLSKQEILSVNDWNVLLADHLARNGYRYRLVIKRIKDKYSVGIIGLVINLLRKIIVRISIAITRCLYKPGMFSKVKKGSRL